MVDTQELRGQIERQRRQIASARRKVQEFDPKVKQTARQIRSRTLEQRQDIRRQEQQRREAKSRALQDVKQQEQQFEAQASVAEQQIAQVEAARAQADRIRRAEKLVSKKGARAIQIARGSDISSEVRRIVEQRDLIGTGKETGQTTVAEVQARVEALKESQRKIEIDTKAFGPQLPPETIQEKIVGTEQGIPIKKVVVVKGGKERPATAEETKRFLQQTAVVTGVAKPTGILSKTESFVSKKRAELESKTARGKISEQQRFGRSIPLGILASGVSTVAGGIQFARAPIRTSIEGVKGLGKTTLQLATGKAPTGIQKGVSTLFRDPGFALGFIGGEIAQAGVGTVATSKISKTLTKVGTKLDPRFRKIQKVDTLDSKIRIPTTAGKETTVTVTKRGATQLRQPIQEQVAKAGTQVDAVSAARDFFGAFRGQRTVDKPILVSKGKAVGGEELLTTSTRKKLKEFRKGKLSQAEVIELDVKLRQEGAKGVLETSFFADPEGRFRIGRTGVGKQERAGISDVLFGETTIRRQKPQAIVFPGTTVEALPVALKDVEKALKAGKPLTSSQQQRLLTFQLRRSGQFKPVGFISREPEVILPPGETIRKRKTTAVTLIDDTRVPIIEAEIVKASDRLSELRAKQSFGTLTEKELVELNKLLSKETGISASSVLESRPLISGSQIGVTGAIVGSLFISPTQATSPSASVSVLKSPVLSTSPSSGIVSSVKRSLAASVPSPVSPQLSVVSVPRITSGISPIGTISSVSSFIESPSIAPSPSPSITPTTTSPVVPSPVPKTPRVMQTISSLIKPRKSSPTGPAFETVIFRGGKQRVVATRVSRKAARDIGAKTVLGGLGATFAIRQVAGRARRTRTQDTFQRFRQLFRAPVGTSKLLGLGEEVFIQKKERVGAFGGRLAFGGELLEIKRAKKKKGRKKRAKGFSFF